MSEAVADDTQEAPPELGQHEISLPQTEIAAAAAAAAALAVEQPDGKDDGGQDPSQDTSALIAEAVAAASAAVNMEGRYRISKAATNPLRVSFLFSFIWPNY